MKKKSKLYYTSILLMILSIPIVIFSAYKIYSSQMVIEENLSLWNDIKSASLSSTQTVSAAVIPDSGLVGEVQIESIDLQVPLIAGSSEKDLEKGAVHFSGTAGFGEVGNAIVLGHRDGVFRPLEHLQLNDEILIETLNGTYTYIIERLEIVTPSDPLIIADYDYPALTLVTCYPFHFIGNAPDRYIAIARLSVR